MSDLPVLPSGLIAVGLPGRRLLLLTLSEFHRARDAGAATDADIPPGLVPVRFGRRRLLLRGPAFARALRRADRWREALRTARREAKAQRSATAPTGQPEVRKATT